MRHGWTTCGATLLSKKKQGAAALSLVQQPLVVWDDLKCPPRLTGCGTQHPHRALGGTCVLLAAAPTTSPCFRRWRRSSSLLSHLQRKNYIYICGSETPAGVSEPHFHREKLLTEAVPSVKMRLSRPAGRDNHEISIEVPLKNGQSEAETIRIVLLFI